MPEDVLARNIDSKPTAEALSKRSVSTLTFDFSVSLQAWNDLSASTSLRPLGPNAPNFRGTCCTKSAKVPPCDLRFYEYPGEHGCLQPRTPVAVAFGGQLGPIFTLVLFTNRAIALLKYTFDAIVNTI